MVKDQKKMNSDVYMFVELWCVYVCASRCVCVHVSACGWVLVDMRVCARICVSMCMDGWVCVYVRMCAHVCECVPECVTDQVAAEEVLNSRGLKPSARLLGLSWFLALWRHSLAR